MKRKIFRDDNVDKSKGIGIILMLMGHSILLTWGWSNIIFNIIFSFHMPLFFVYSGYYFSSKKMTQVIRGGIEKLVKPYFMIAAIAIIVLSFISMDDALNYLKGCIVGALGSPVSKIRFHNLQAGPIWFLLALFWCKIFYSIIIRISPRYKLILSLIVSALAIPICYRLINIPLCIGAGVTVVMFYAIGHYIKENGGMANMKHKWFFISIWFVSVFFMTLNTAQYSYKCLPVNIIASIGGILAVYKISQLLEGTCGRILILFGQNTMTILGCHTIAYAHYTTFMKILGLDLNDALSNDLMYLGVTGIYFIIFWGIKKIKFMIKYLSFASSTC